MMQLYSTSSRTLKSLNFLNSQTLQVQHLNWQPVKSVRPKSEKLMPLLSWKPFYLCTSVHVYIYICLLSCTFSQFSPCVFILHYVLQHTVHIDLDTAIDKG